jgi:hypothetical protein
MQVHNISNTSISLLFTDMVLFRPKQWYCFFLGWGFQYTMFSFFLCLCLGFPLNAKKKKNHSIKEIDIWPLGCLSEETQRVSFASSFYSYTHSSFSAPLPLPIIHFRWDLPHFLLHKVHSFPQFTASYFKCILMSSHSSS